MKVKEILNQFKKILFLILGILSATFGLKSFLLPNKFIDGGVTGLSMLTSVLSSIPISIFVIIFNMPFIILAFYNLSKELAIRAIFGILGLSLALAIIPFPILTYDRLLVAIFGGFFLGAGIAFAIRGGGVIDGTEILAVFLSRKLHTTVGDIILAINIIIFSIVALFLGIEVAFYSILTYLSASKTTDYIIEGIEEYIAVIIVSEHPEELRKAILFNLGRGATIFKGRKGLSEKEPQSDIDILYTVLTRLELPKLTVEINKIDPKAFVVMHKVKDTIGGYIKKRPQSVI
ncbi:MAG: YitT family protein [Ignavibacteria bacterium]|nr:YitT family protein [Ignavibacteria bacterium]